MEFKAFSFEQNSHTYAQAKRLVADSIADTAIYFDSYSDSKILFGKIAEALEQADVLLIGIEPKAYLKFKPFLIKAFSFTPAYSDKIADAIEDRITDETIKKAHSLIPNEAEEILTSDGLFSGFYVHEEGQHIIVFPLLDNIAETLQSTDLPFFKAKEDMTEVFADIKTGSSPKASSIIEKLLKNDFKIAIPSTPASKLLKADIKACDDYADFVFFTPFVTDSGVNDPKQYAAQLAKGAMELRNTQLGATISNIFREKNGDKITSYYAFVSVATADKVVVKKLFANPDESIDNLITEATAELYQMIDKYIDEVAFKLSASDEDADKYEASLIEAEVVSDVRPEASISKTGIIVAIIAIILAVVACIVLALKLGDYFVKPTDNQVSDSLQAGDTLPVEVPPLTNTPQPVVTAGEPSNTVAELTDTPSSTGIFDITTTLPIADTNYIIINPNGGSNNNNNTTASTTEKKDDPSTTATTSSDIEGVEAGW